MATIFELIDANNLDGLTQFLKENKDLVNSRNKEGETPLYVATHRGHAAIVEELLKSQANPDTPKSDTSMETPILWAAFAGKTDIVEMLLKYKANPNLSDKEGRTPLYLAAWKGHAEAVEILLKNKADPNLSNIDGNTPLRGAVQKGHAEIVEMLLKYQADPNIVPEAQGTLLHSAASAGHSKIVESLLSYGANAEAVLRGDSTIDAMQQILSSKAFPGCVGIDFSASQFNFLLQPDIDLAKYFEGKIFIGCTGIPDQVRKLPDTLVIDNLDAVCEVIDPTKQPADKLLSNVTLGKILSLLMQHFTAAPEINAQGIPKTLEESMRPFLARNLKMSAAFAALQKLDQIPEEELVSDVRFFTTRKGTGLHRMPQECYDILEHVPAFLVAMEHAAIEVEHPEGKQHPLPAPK